MQPQQHKVMAIVPDCKTRAQTYPVVYVDALAARGEVPFPGVGEGVDALAARAVRAVGLKDNAG